MFGVYEFQHLQSLLSDIYRGRRIDVRPFGYVFDFATVADNGIVVATQKIIGNADFIACSASFSAVETFVGFATTMQIEDSGSQERFFNQPVAIGMFASSGSDQQRGITYPRRVAGNSTLTATLTASEALTTPQLYLDGVHVFVYGN